MGRKPAPGTFLATLVYSLVALTYGSNPWPLPLIFFSPVGVVYLLVVRGARAVFSRPVRPQKIGGNGEFTRAIIKPKLRRPHGLDGFLDRLRELGAFAGESARPIDPWNR